MEEKIRRDDAAWKKQLTQNQYFVTRKKGTEPPFTGEYEDTETAGTYKCVCCGQPLFRSETKYHSGSGWPSFSAPASEQAVEAESDMSHGMKRTEVKCSRCDAHLGHVFDDGPVACFQDYTEKGIKPPGRNRPPGWLPGRSRDPKRRARVLLSPTDT